MAPSQPEPIAIVGSACRFPGGANSPSSLWKLLQNPHDVGSEIGPDRFDASSFYHPDGSHHGTSNVLRSYLMQNDIRLFDAAFFNLSPSEADAMDPQQRLLLETVYEALEAGGHGLHSLRGSDTAVYVGTMTADYNDTLIRDHNTMPKYYATGTNRAIISNRVSYFFDWHGPSMTIDTACSSSLVAVHQGVQALRSGESSVAIAAGTQVILGPEMYIGESKLKMLSPNGRSAMWDAAADGYARGEGVAAVILKRLSDAIADGDHIECIVRETGVNQDGFSNGLTVPSTDAQAKLIRQTYKRAGLDLNQERDRPQFFEAHGTGTPAGDPKEAAAIAEVFGASGKDKLYVGSVKTIIGHLEGCAGLAGLLKASVMIREGKIAPNLHFNRLNPKIEPLYGGLEVPTKLLDWPEVEGVPRRASVNSFGFGGTNAHAILEQYRPPSKSTPPTDTPISFTPFVFSAASESSLVEQLKTFSSFLQTNPSLNPADLAWTLHSRRSQLSTKAALPATTLTQLLSQIDMKLASEGPIGRRSVTTKQPRILGIFTGQGAQWASMLSGLIQTSPFVSTRIDDLSSALTTLPEEHRPKWDLRGELLAAGAQSRLSEAALSQPLCTAIQVVLVDLLRAAGVSFSAAVGHSSGEIAAAYTAGFLSDTDAIRIAYYRGLYANLAGNKTTGQKGAMMAIGASWTDADSLVQQERFQGRLAVAAHNSPGSVTLSGDEDAVKEAKGVFDAEKKFARLLKVDTAYHSHHMLPCGESYVAALRACGVKVRPEGGTEGCKWFSSVTANKDPVVPGEELRDIYWRDNMTGAVLFAEALQNAVAATEGLDLAIEVGPHPALKGPATETISKLRTAPLPYTGVLSRGKNDVEAFSDAMGFLWTHLPSVDMGTLAKTMSGREPKLVVGLPAYAWDHSRSYWAESRISKRTRTRKLPHHEVLGFLSPDANAHDMRWVNVLKRDEMPWLDGHQLSGVTIFPAAGYVAMALEACRIIAGDRAIRLLEVQNLTIPKAITLDDEPGVETLVVLTGIQHSGDTTTAHFSCFAVPVQTSGAEHDMELSASASVEIFYGERDMGAIFYTPSEEYNLTPVDVEQFYSAISTLGYNYSGPFRTLSSPRRKLDQVHGFVDSYQYPDSDIVSSPYLVHPTMLDVAFQAAILAFSAPGDDRLWSLSVPTAIGTIRVNPEVCAALPLSSTKVPVRTTTIGSEISSGFSADIDILDEGAEYAMLQVEELVLRPLAPATKADDRVMFTNVKIDVSSPDGTLVSSDRPSNTDEEVAEACERITCYYLQKCKSEIAGVRPQGWGREFLNWLDTALSATKGKHASLSQDWAGDSEEIDSLIGRYQESVDVQVLSSLGQNLSGILHGDVAVDSIVSTDLLASWYASGLGVSASHTLLGGMLRQVAHRYPHATILEVASDKSGGAASRVIFNSIGDKFSSFTYATLAGTFPADDAFFKSYGPKVAPRALDMTAPPTEQDFAPNSFDIVVASSGVLLATNVSLQTTLDNLRQLVRPGGFLLVQDTAHPAPLHHRLISTLLSSSFSSPTPGDWHSLLRKSSFSGIDTLLPSSLSPWSILLTQSISPLISFLRRPLSAPLPTPPVQIQSLIILGSASLETARLAEHVVEYLRPFCGTATVLEGLPTEAESRGLSPMSTFINLVDLEEPVFKDMNDETMDGLKRMLDLAKHVIWVTRGARKGEPFQMASVGFGRSIRQEARHVNFGEVDLDPSTERDGDGEARVLVEYILQQVALDEWEAPPSALADGAHRGADFLWSREPEVYVDGRGKVLIPRLMPDEERNERLNSSRRSMTREVALNGKSNLAVLAREGSDELALQRLVTGRQDGQPVRIHSSSLHALRVAADAFLFLGVGKSSLDGTWQVLLSTSNSLQTPGVVSFTVARDDAEDLDSDILAATVAGELVAESLLQQLPAHSRAIVHCSAEDVSLAAALTWRAGSRNVHVTFTCNTQVRTEFGKSWIALADNTSEYSLRKLVRRVMPTHFLDLTSTSLGARLGQTLLPLGCIRVDPTTLFRREASPSLTTDRQALLDRLVDALSGTGVVHCPSPNHAPTHHITPLPSIPSLAKGVSHPTSIISWPVSGSVSTSITPITFPTLFSPHKSYLLVGLSGQIGQSLTEFLIANGAGTVVLASRRPAVDAKWLASFRHLDAAVKVVALDVMSLSSVENAVAEIRKTCPPIGGVANGAALFDDQLFGGMSGNTMRRVLGPKVVGSQNLDTIFGDQELDFFVLFSSAVAVFGNAGQTNYAAANGFLDGLVRKRRAQGLAGSAINLGRVAGVGYVEAAGQAVTEQLVKKLGLPPVSETDLRQIFAEAVLAGYEEGDPVITTGLRVVGDDEDLRGPWFSNSFFAHMVRESSVSMGSDKDKKDSLPVGQQLAAAETKEAALEILQDAFAARLRVILQLGDRKIEHEAPLLELGIDSLVAVEVRSWFVRELKVDVPVLKIVGGSSLAELCQWVLDKVPEELLAPTESKPAATPEEAPAKPQKVISQEPPQRNISQESLHIPVPGIRKAGTDSYASSTSGHTLNLLRATPTSTTSLASTTTVTPSSGSDADVSEWENNKAIPEKPALQFLKSERISLPQSRFWFLGQLLDDPTTFNIVFSYRISGTLRVGDLERAVRIVSNRHESLRTCFVADDADAGNAYQKVISSSPLRLERKKISSPEDVDAEFADLRTHIFDLARGDLMRMLLLTLDASNHFLLINYHHIAMDGASFNVFLADLEKAYNGQTLGPAPRQYPEFSAAQRRALDGNDMKEELDYWRSVFPAGEQPPVLPLLPMARSNSRVAMKTFDTFQVAAPLSPELVARIRAVSRAQRCTPFHLHLAAFQTLLFSLAGEDTTDLTIGIADAARNDADVKESIGFFLNLLTLRFRRKADLPFSSAIAEARKTAYAALGTSRLPFDVLLTELNIARSSLHSPFFQAFLDYRQGIQEKYPWGNTQWEFRDVHPGRTAYDITLDVTDWDAKNSLVMFRVQKGLYDQTAAELLLETYLNVLDVLTRDPEIALKDTPVFSEKQLERAVMVGRGPNLVSDWPPTLPHRIDQVAKQNHDRVALMDGLGNVLTYSDMIKRIEAISEALHNNSIGPGSRVLVYQQPSADWPCSMLAIMRLGAVYVPLDLRNPMVRLAAVAKDCAPSAILADNTTVDSAPQLEATNARIINVSGLPSHPRQRAPNVADANSPAAILYTSGSTGTPKGIRVTHAGLRNEIEGYTKTWGLTAERVLQQSAFTFNHSSDQMYTGLVNGGMVYIVPDFQRGDPLSITAIIKEHKITYTKATPSEYLLWMQFGGHNLREASSWRFAFGGGEQLQTTVTQEFANLGLRDLRFFNSYGPTEISISSHKMEMPYTDENAMGELGRIPCGYSLPNYYTYIVDQKTLKPVPVGMPGEVCIGGAGVSLGYLHNKELTDKHFVGNPFVTQEDRERGWNRMYRTGDIGHLQSDGAMVFHNRMAGDSQVKIRGLRIELSDIESNLVETSGGVVREAVVTLREGESASPFLVAHVVLAPQHRDMADKQGFLVDLLRRLPVPQYMVPVAAIPLDRFPLSNHSKVDRKAVQNMALPERLSTSPGETVVEMTETMTQLVPVWREVLGSSLDKFGFDLGPATNFFLVGGNSLLVIRLQATIRRVFRVAIPLVKLLGASSLGEMAQLVEETSAVDSINWDNETAPPSIPEFLSGILSVNSIGRGKTILLTGATGFLGRHLLPLLTSREDISEIHCLAVRNPTKLESQTSSLPSDHLIKIVSHTGDLTAPLFGLSSAEFTRLATSGTAIIHLGASRSFWDSYHVLRGSNVSPLKELVKLATPKKMGIHFVSTSSVFPEGKEAEESAEGFVPPTDGSGGYAASKWAGERVLERSAQGLGVRGRVYRFVSNGDVVQKGGDTEKGELMEEFLRLTREARALPDMGVWRGRIDLVKVDEAVERLVEVVMREQGDEGKVGFYHYASPLAVHTDELREFLEARVEGKEKMETVPVLKWFGRLKGLGFSYVLAAQDATVGDGKEVLESRR